MVKYTAYFARCYSPPPPSPLPPPPPPSPLPPPPLPQPVLIFITVQYLHKKFFIKRLTEMLQANRDCVEKYYRMSESFSVADADGPTPRLRKLIELRLWMKMKKATVEQKNRTVTTTKQ